MLILKNGKAKAKTTETETKKAKKTTAAAVCFTLNNRDKRTKEDGKSRLQSL